MLVTGALFAEGQANLRFETKSCRGKAAESCPHEMVNVPFSRDLFFLEKFLRESVDDVPIMPTLCMHEAQKASCLEDRKYSSMIGIIMQMK